MNRNVLCPKYDACLDKAVLELADDFNCSGCKLERVRLNAGDLPASDIEACYKLLAVLFRPDITPWGPREKALDDLGGV